MIHPVIIQGSNVVLAEGQDEYTTLHGRAEMVPLSATSETFVPSIAVAFQMELDDIKMLMDGGRLMYRQLGASFAPMLLWVEPAEDPVDMRAASIPPRA